MPVNNKTKKARPDGQTEQEIKAESLSGSAAEKSSDYLWFDDKIILAKIGDRVYRRELNDLSDNVKALGEIDLWLQEKGIDKKSVFYVNVDFFDKLADGSQKLVKSLNEKEPFTIEDAQENGVLYLAVQLRIAAAAVKSLATILHNDLTGKEGGHTGSFENCSSCAIWRDQIAEWGVA